MTDYHVDTPMNLKSRALPPFDKYYYYNISVQSTEADVEFLGNVYQELRGHSPRSLREDFCGTFALCSAWVEAHPDAQAYGVDLDPEPIAYGKERYYAKLTNEQKARVHIINGDVLEHELPAVDVACALNFSYFAFKQRAQLKHYLSKVYDSLNDQGVFFLDCFGGGKCQEANEEETEDEDLGFSYFWDQDSYDPISGEGRFYIHFQRHGEAKRERVFSYDWRMWSIPELRDLLAEVGFRASYIYWEGNDEDGDGNGIFERVEKGEECDAWVAYIAATK